MKTNTRAKNVNRTHEGGMAAPRQGAELELRRAVASCLLWERQFYESGSDIADRIAALCRDVPAETVSAIAIEARTKLGLRGVPLLLARELARGQGPVVARTIEAVVQRADELAEFLAIYWRGGRCPLSAQTKKGLARAFRKFGPYALAKYNRDGVVKLRDALFLCHAKPKDDAQAATWKQLVDKTLAPPDTWEVALSAGADKRATWERLMAEGQLGALALLRNLRNMEEAKVDRRTIITALASAKTAGILPFQFIAASKAAPGFDEAISDMAIRALGDTPKLPGRTCLIIDVSGSMQAALSGRTTLDRVDAACGQAMLVREVCEDSALYATAGNDHARIHATVKLPARRGFALADAIRAAMGMLGGGGIFLVQCMKAVAAAETAPFDRVIVFTDEQDCDLKLNPGSAPKLGRFNYINNVASYKPGIDTSHGWQRVNGFSERLCDWIRLNEQEPVAQ